MYNHRTCGLGLAKGKPSFNKYIGTCKSLESSYHRKHLHQAFNLICFLSQFYIKHTQAHSSTPHSNQHPQYNMKTFSATSVLALAASIIAVTAEIGSDEFGNTKLLIPTPAVSMTTLVDGIRLPASLVSQFKAATSALDISIDIPTTLSAGASSTIIDMGISSISIGSSTATVTSLSTSIVIAPTTTGASASGTGSLSGLAGNGNSTTSKPTGSSPSPSPSHGAASIGRTVGVRAGLLAGVGLAFAML